jgi:hypothetical protein
MLHHLMFTFSKCSETQSWKYGIVKYESSDNSSFLEEIWRVTELLPSYYLLTYALTFLKK